MILRTRRYWVLAAFPALVAALISEHVHALALALVFTIVWLLALGTWFAFEIKHSQHRRRLHAPMAAAILIGAVLGAARVNERVLMGGAWACVLGCAIPTLLLCAFSRRKPPPNKGALAVLALIVIATALAPVLWPQQIAFSHWIYYATAAIAAAVTAIIIFALHVAGRERERERGRGRVHTPST
jgi:threonine/homoserine/homoserine lactone efflux protein